MYGRKKIAYNINVCLSHGKCSGRLRNHTRRVLSALSASEKVKVFRGRIFPYRAIQETLLGWPSAIPHAVPELKDRQLIHALPRESRKPTGHTPAHDKNRDSEIAFRGRSRSPALMRRVHQVFPAAEVKHNLVLGFEVLRWLLRGRWPWCHQPGSTCHFELPMQPELLYSHFEVRCRQWIDYPLSQL